MGIFDFMKRKRPPSADGDADDDGPSPEYVFAHIALRMIALNEPLMFLGLAASPDFRKFIDSVLDQVATQCGRRMPYGSESINVYPVKVKSFPCAIIELPEPTEIACAHLVALVGLVDTTQDEPPADQDIHARYFTLEKGVSLDGEPHTVLCEWDDSSHSNFGEGPPANPKNFAEAISNLL